MAITVKTELTFKVTTVALKIIRSRITTRRKVIITPTPGRMEQLIHIQAVLRVALTEVMGIQTKRNLDIDSDMRPWLTTMKNIQ